MDSIKGQSKKNFPDAKFELTNDFQTFDPEIKITNFAELSCKKCFEFGEIKGKTCECCQGSGHIDDCNCNKDENQLSLF